MLKRDVTDGRVWATSPVFLAMPGPQSRERIQRQLVRRTLLRSRYERRKRTFCAEVVRLFLTKLRNEMSSYLLHLQFDGVNNGPNSRSEVQSVASTKDASKENVMHGHFLRPLQLHDRQLFRLCA